MSFVESPRFPDKLGYGASGGPQFRTSIVELSSGFEQRNADWSVERRRYDLIHTSKTREDFDEMLAYYIAVARGRLNGFRFRDWSDYNDTHGDAVGWLGGGVGAGVPSYQMYKRYVSGSNAALRAISKPYGTIAVTRGGVSVTYATGSPQGAGEITINTETGIITFQADVALVISLHTCGSSHQFRTATDLGLSIGEYVYLSGITGTAGDVLNGIAHTITNKVLASPTEYIWTISTNTGGSPTLTGSGGTAYAYPQADEALLWSGEFDVPVRFDTDELMTAIRGQRLFDFDRIPLVEIRV